MRSAQPGAGCANFSGLFWASASATSILADALGGTCGPQRPSEIGVLDVELTPEGVADPIFAGMPVQQKCLQWHSVRVAQAPEGAIVLARSPACSIQAMRIGRHAWSMQYHVEIEPETVANWGEVPAYRRALETTLGAEALPQLKADADANIADLTVNARKLYENFRRSLTG